MSNKLKKFKEYNFNSFIRTIPVCAYLDNKHGRTLYEQAFECGMYNNTNKFNVLINSVKRVGIQHPCRAKYFQSEFKPQIYKQGFKDGYKVFKRLVQNIVFTYRGLYVRI